MNWAEAAVRLAVWMLPRRLRDTYREQWQADLRDAAEVDLRRSDVARGALAFAVSVDRPLPDGLRSPGPDGVIRRSRLAVALALGAAIAAIAQVAAGVVVESGGMSRLFLINDVAVLVVPSPYVVYAVLAPLAAVAMVSLTHGTAPRVLLAVWLLALASAAPLSELRVDLFAPALANLRFGGGAVAVPVALALLAAAVVVLSRESILMRGAPAEVPARRRLVAAAAGALAVWTTAAVGLLVSIRVWAEREPLYFGDEITPATQAMFDEWVAHKQSFEQLVNSVFLGAAIAAAVLGAVVLAIGAWRRAAVGTVVVASAAGILIVLIASAAIFQFLYQGTPTAVPPVRPDLLLAVGQYGLIALTLVSVGRIRFSVERRAHLQPAAR